MANRKNPSTLYQACLQYLIPKIEHYAKESNFDGTQVCQGIEKLPGLVAQDLLLQSYELANVALKRVWKEEWKIYYTSKIISAIFSWDEDLVNYIRKRCLNLRQIEVVHLKKFKPELIGRLPKGVVTLDFDGELMKRGQTTKPLVEEGDEKKGWLADAEETFKALQLRRRKPPDIPPSATLYSLAELHLGTVAVTAEDLKSVLTSCPCLRLLRHYQMLTALYGMHAEAWRNKKSLPVYKLRNLDVDFSHVVRCRMSPEWVLAPDALQLAVLLCPSASVIRVRFDCSTPNDVLAPLLSLAKVKEFSAVCVSSGERTLLDFSDMAPLLEKHGQSSLTHLELKVIEEVEIHQVIEHCTRLESLMLSGCGYVTPPTCPSFSCQNYARGTFKKLKLLFFADGDDFSWDHGVPECFWKASLFPSGRSRVVQLEGLFLEFPRIPATLSRELFPRGPHSRLPFPEMQVLSLCRWEELTMEDVAAICGLNGEPRCRSLQRLWISECEGISTDKVKRLKGWFKQSNMGHVCLHVDDAREREDRKPYTFRIKR